ncbi:MAG: fasciclin domain-containing protein [Pedobacter sp.]|uniref:fasciclin domain-containing protein n=1 Tax=Pedobacter sp. TaxID=1411316 RepID=UPI0028066F7B|nr:fasciclin domain-containing protein [Pedobacter sp.]MDQ8003355.1 fasciclin domain-containing protein [Pedobacter sp.]
MKKILFALVAAILFTACTNNQPENTTETSDNASASENSVGQSAVVDDVSNPNIVQVAAKSPDFTTLVTAVKAAGLTDALSNAGPFTVFAPTNTAFDKLPKGTVEDLLKPEKKDDLSNILGYHTYVGVLDGVLLQDGLEYDMVFGGKVKITQKDGKNYVNGSEIISTVKASNGVIHVISDVLLPK